MFTGIVSDIGTISRIERRGDLRAVIETAYETATIALGASIACSGVCLTVVDTGPGWFAVDISAETASRTAQGLWNEGARLNLERAMKLGDELGGHIVTGHIDGFGEIVSVEPIGDSTRVTIVAAADLAPFIASKGSITLDGVSLTVNTVADRGGGQAEFTVNLIPHTAQVTTLGAIAAGRAVNIEIDVLARYLGRMKEALAA